MTARTRLIAPCLALAFLAIADCTDPDHGGGPLHPGDTIAGELTSSDHANPAPFSGYPGDGTVPLLDDGGVYDTGTLSPDAVIRADVFTLDLQAGQSLQVVMCRAGDNSALDPFLIVDFAGAHLLADDDSAGDLDARVQIDAATTGAYTIYATTATGRVAETGGRNYVLRAAILDATNPGPLTCGM